MELLIVGGAIASVMLVIIDVIGSLSHRIEDVIDAAERVGYTTEEIRAAIDLALHRKTVSPR
ncbi:hypothetical protein EKD04_021910 [Chloroflexales bacterium ZM16-3]|nr:hypothetical protein [Chloroflexales bacterium ZM16-3]